MSVSGAPAVNVYSKLTYQGVEYSLPNGKAFLFCRGTTCGDATYLGASGSDASTMPDGYRDFYNDHCYQKSSDGWSSITASVPSSYVISPANADLQAALGGSTAFTVVYRT